MTLTPKQKKVAYGIAAVTVVGIAICIFFSRRSKTRTASDAPPSGLYDELVIKKLPLLSSHYIDAWGSSTPTPGGAIMKNYAFGGLTDANVLTLSNHLHTWASAHWTWQGSGAGSSTHAGTKMLDGLIANLAGECGYIANALYVLLIAKTPYGVGQDDSKFKVVTYSGKYHDGKSAENRGFISRHQNSPLNLPSNIYDSHGSQSDFYQWANHKVLEYNGKFFDPTYGTTQGGPGEYAQLEDMAEAQIYDTITPGDGQFGGIFVSCVFMTDDAAGALKGFYIECYANRTTKMFSTAPHPDHDMCVIIGPFIEAGGNAANKFNYDKTKNYLHGLDPLH